MLAQLLNLKDIDLRESSLKKFSCAKSLFFQLSHFTIIRETRVLSVCVFCDSLCLNTMSRLLEAVAPSINTNKV